VTPCFIRRGRINIREKNELKNKHTASTRKFAIAFHDTHVAGILTAWTYAKNWKPAPIIIDL
jgi:hypothetical protein